MEYGKWAFIIGIVLAILAGLVPQLQGSYIVTWLLVVLGLIVGFLNVTDKETQPYLLSAIALMVVGSAGITVFGSLGSIVQSVLGNIVAFVAPGALLVSLKTVWAISKDA